MTTFHIGSVIDDKYRIIARLGAGGAASVYKAEEIQLSRTVAVKVLHRYKVDGKSDYQRFQQEASILAGLSHRNIVAVYRFGLLDEQEPFMVFEYAEGQTLTTRLSKGPLTEQKTVDIGIKISQALSYAHQRDVVHRDLNPQNIMLQQGPEPDAVKILDFELSKILNMQNPDAERLTLTGEVMGTLEYMSPEQSRGAVVDPRTDIYSIGCILYECVAGRAPLKANNPIEMLYKQRYEWPESLALISDKNNRPSNAFEQIVFKCLQKDPDKRFQSASELETALKLLQSGRTQDLTYGNIQVGSKTQTIGAGIPKAVPLAVLVVVFATVGLTIACFVYSSNQRHKVSPVQNAQVKSKIDTKPKDSSSEVDSLIDKIPAEGSADADSLESEALDYFGKSNYAAAKPRFLRVLKLREEQSDATENLSRIIEIYEKEKNYDEAERILLHWLPIKERLLGRFHEDIAHCLTLLGHVYWDKHQYAKADESFERAVTIAQKAETPLLQARILHALAHFYIVQGKLAKAETLAKRAESIFEKNYGSNTDIANELDLLAALCRIQHNYPEGVKLEKRSLICRENALADVGLFDSKAHKPKVNALTDEQPADVESKTNREKVLLIRDLANSSWYLATIYIDMGKFAEAEQLCKRSIEISEKFLGSVGPDIFNEANVLDTYAVVLRSTNRNAEAEKIASQAAARRSAKR